MLWPPLDQCGPNAVKIKGIGLGIHRGLNATSKRAIVRQATRNFTACKPGDCGRLSKLPPPRYSV